MAYVNEYQESRLNYNEKQSKDKRYSQEAVAELTGTSISTIKRVESGDSIPNHSLVAQLSKIYNDTGLLRNYCAHHCDIGKALNKTNSNEFQPKSLFEAGYGLISANENLDTFKTELFDILADGKVDADEVVRLREILVNLDKVQEIIDVIKEMIQNHEDFNEIDR